MDLLLPTLDYRRVSPALVSRVADHEYLVEEDSALDRSACSSCETVACIVQSNSVPLHAHLVFGRPAVFFVVLGECVAAMAASAGYEMRYLYRGGEGRILAMHPPWLLTTTGLFGMEGQLLVPRPPEDFKSEARLWRRYDGAIFVGDAESVWKRCV